ncbi:MAG: hypothetical protein ACOWW1_06620 [archaeon]
MDRRKLFVSSTIDAILVLTIFPSIFGAFENCKAKDLVKNQTNKISITQFSTSELRTVENCIILNPPGNVKTQNFGILRHRTDGNHCTF